MKEDFVPLDWVLDMWNELIMDVYDIWRQEQIENDPNLPTDYDESEEYEDYIDAKYGYEVFCEDSSANKTLQYITRLGVLND